MKKCTKCGIEKPFDEFQVRRASKDGMTAACKSCLSLYDKSRANLPHRIAARARYAKTDAYAESHDNSARKYRRKNPVKYRAHSIVSNAIRDKKLFREPCEICGSIDSIHAHHDDYAKPLNIRWLCAAHHKQWHRDNGEGANPA